MCRFGAGELHVIAAIVGGMAAQESIKIITKQFTPVSGTLVYNGIMGTTSTFYT
jgi:amyloid beta precursor protein binding protein 1